MRHRILIYGGLGDVASERIIPALISLKEQFSIEFAIVDLKDKGTGVYYKYGHEPLRNYNIAIIATPNNTHAEIAIRVIDTGMHILCEKPLAHRLEAAKEILAAAKKCPKQVTMLCDHYLYKPTVRELIKNWTMFKNEIGEIKSVKTKVLESPLQKGREWLLIRKISGGGVAMDTGFHLASILGKLFGYEKITVKGAEMTRWEETPGDGETFAKIMLNIKDIRDIPAIIEVGKWMPEIRKELIFSGENGKLEVDIDKGQIKINDKVVKNYNEDDSYRIVLTEFLSAVEERKPLLATIEEGYKTLKIIKYAYSVSNIKGSWR